MIDFIFQKYQNLVNNASGAVIQFREQISGALWMEGKINSFSGNPITPSLPVEQTNFSLTMFDLSGAGRISGIDNYHNDKVLHGHIASGSIIIPGAHNLASVGSYAFLEFFQSKLESVLA